MDDFTYDQPARRLSSMTLPHIVLVPGFWEGPSAFSSVFASLTAEGCAVTTIPLQSTGAPVSDHSPAFQDDVAAIRKTLLKIISLGTDVLIVGHAEGAFLASHATKGLAKHERARRGKAGGVVKFAFIAGAIFPVGHVHRKADFMMFKDGQMFCRKPRELLFNDMSDEDAQAEINKLRPEPQRGWGAQIKYAGWANIDTDYLICTADEMYPAEIQAQLAIMPPRSRIAAVNAGHSAPISKPDAVVRFIRRAAGESV